MRSSSPMLIGRLPHVTRGGVRVGWWGWAGGGGRDVWPMRATSAASAAKVQSKSLSRLASCGASHADPLTPAEPITVQISAMLERGVRPRIKSWDDLAPPDALVLPLRSCGTPYRGMNIIALWAATLKSGFEARRWFTCKQALARSAAGPRPWVTIHLRF